MTLRSFIFLIVSLLLPSAAAAQSFQLNDVRFSDSIYLSDAELNAVATQYEGRTVGFDDLEALLADVQALYLQSGILTARAVLPPQEIVDGVLRVELVEATVAEVRVSELNRTDPRFVRNSISLEPGEAPDFEALERDLRIYEISHDVRPQLQFEPGDEPGTTVATINIEEPEFQRWSASINNFGNEQTGELQASVVGQLSSLTRWRDTLSIQARISEGSYGGGLAYSRPVGTRGARVNAALGISTADVISGAFLPVNIETDSISGTFGYRRPFRIRPNSHFTVEANYVYERSESTLSGLLLSDVAINEAVAQVGYFHLKPGRSFSALAGIKAGRADAEEVSLTEGSYQLAFGSFGYLQALGSRLALDMGMTWQYAQDENLPVGRLYSAGGIDTVRGYPVNVRSGDSGLVLRAQLGSLRPIALGQSGFSAQPFGFVDAGAVLPFRTEISFDSDQDLLASAGFGVRLSGFRDASALLLVAAPFRDTLGFEADGATVYAGLDWPF